MSRFDNNERSQRKKRIAPVTDEIHHNGQAHWPGIQTNRSLHRFLFVWVSLVYVWGMLHLLVADIKIYKCWYNSALPLSCAPLTFFWSNLHPLQAIEFTSLILLYGTLLWAGLTRRIPVRWHWLSFLLQAGTVFIISMVIRQDNVVLSLYLVLTLEAVGMLRKANVAVTVASISLILFVFNEFYSRGILKSWTTALISLWISNDYAALSLFLIGYLMLYVQLSHAHEELAKTHSDLSASTRQIEELTRLTERQRLARELHDTLSQGVLGLKLQLEAVDALLVQQSPDQAREIIRHAMKQVQATLNDARCSIDDLRSNNAMNLNCVEAVKEVIERFCNATGIPCSVDLDALSLLPATFHEHVLRIISEGLANIARHAQATEVWINAMQVDNMLQIQIQDNGIGFTPAIVIQQAGHYGLLGLRERARMVGGRLEIQSAPGSGTSICFFLPYNQKIAKHTKASL